MDSAGILLLDDGELSDVADLLDELGLAYTRVRGGEVGDRLPPPRDLLVTTPRRAERVRRGSPMGASVGRPVRIIAVEEDSTAMRRMLRRMGFHLLVRLPSEAAIWRLLIRRALYQGDERRAEQRVAMGAPVSLAGPGGAPRDRNVTLIDISNRGCRLVGSACFDIDEAISIDLRAPVHAGASVRDVLTLSGRVARVSDETGDRGAPHAASVIFDEDMPESTRTRLGDLINHWSMGPPAIAEARDAGPPLPPCKSRAIPGLTLDDETDPAIRVGESVALHLGGADGAEESAGVTRLANDRRGQPRGAFSGTVVATADGARRVLMGRDLSAGGMRIERLPGIDVGDHFRLALYGPSPLEPFEVSARVIRDDGDDGLALAFEDVAPAIGRALEKLIACLPDVESLEADETHGMGAVLSEILDGR